MFIDTSGWLCLYHKDEPEHSEAVELYQNAAVRLTTSYVLAEFVPLAQVRGFPRAQNLEFTQRILDSAEIEIIWIDEILHRQAVALLQERADKTYSLCDAVSFVVMRQRGISESLTSDKHFRQEGFVRLLEK
ncbi:MAG: type II toxin-antitoxin system VapC family toxin [Pyrinomonadaceae bacterium]